MSETKAIWLDAPGCSKRAVRYRQLGGPSADLVAKEAARPGLNQVGYHLAVGVLGAARMVVAYTEPLDYVVKPAPAKPDAKEGDPPAPPIVEDPDLDDPKFVWTVADQPGFEVGAFDRVFNAKDRSVLAKIYNHLHEANAFEVDAILGKARSVK